jgi:hypothetical protein
MDAHNKARDHSYFVRRAAEERAAAGTANDAGAVHAHLQLAKKYERHAQLCAPAEASDIVLSHD